MSTYEDNIDYGGEFNFTLDDIISEFKYEGSEQQLQDIISETKEISTAEAVDYSDVQPESAQDDKPRHAKSTGGKPARLRRKRKTEVVKKEEEEPVEVKQHIADEVPKAESVEIEEDEYSLEAVIASVKAEYAMYDEEVVKAEKAEEVSEASEAEPIEEVEKADEADAVQSEHEMAEDESIHEEADKITEDEMQELPEEPALMEEAVIPDEPVVSEPAEDVEPQKTEEVEDEAPEPESSVFTQPDDIASASGDYVIGKADTENEYADGDIDYAEAQEELEDKQPKPRKVRSESISFREKIINPIIKFLAYVSMRVQQNKDVVSDAPAEEDEDLGPEMPTDRASKFYEKKVAGIRLRMRASFALSIIMTYISLGLPVFGAMRASAVSAAVCLIMLLSVMMLGLDIMTSGILALVKRKPNANSLIFLSCLFSVIDGFIIALGSTKNGLPFCAVSALTISFSLMGSMLNCRSNRITLRAAASARRPYTVTAETSVTGDGITLLKSRQSTNGFVRRVEESGPDEIIFGALSPYLIAAALVLSIIAALIAKNFSGFMHILSGMVAAAVPVSILLSFPLPFFVSSKIMIHSGNSIAGWSGLYDIGKSKHIIITDRDLFPKNDVTIEKVRILSGKNPEEVISYAGSMLAASGSAMAPAFTDLMAKGNGSMLRVDEFSCHESGGLVAIINGEEVFCGSAGFMQLMGIRLPNKLALRDCVYIAASGMLCGIFEMRYNAQRDVKSALASIFRTDRHPIFAVRDFNVTPQMISRKFDIPTDGFDFPAFTERYEISAAKPSDISKPAAIVAREGLGALIKLADHGRLLFNVTRISVLLSVMSAVLGIIIMFIKMSACTASVAGLLIYMIIWLVPEIAVCFLLLKNNY